MELTDEQRAVLERLILINEHRKDGKGRPWITIEKSGEMSMVPFPISAAWKHKVAKAATLWVKLQKKPLEKRKSSRT